nr:hypothetical protein [Candidatus Sigynarchaeota archaeon]
MFVVQMSFIGTPASAVSLEPKNASPAPTIDGLLTDKDGWEKQNSTIFPYINNIVLRVYTCVFNEFIYFGFQYKTDVHDGNESFALACSNALPTNTSVNDSIWSYETVKVFRLDGKSWDEEIIKRERRARNWTSGGNRLEFKAAKITSNFTFYEFRFMRNWTRAGDVNWTWDRQYTIKIFYGTLYGNASEFFMPSLGNWTVSTPGKITLVIPASPDAPNMEDITALKFNTFVGKVVLFTIAGVGVAMVGYIMVRTRSRIKRV